MDFVKQYLVQSITTASNNLRLTSSKIQVVTLLREILMNVENVELVIKELKKLTTFSKFAIKLNEIYHFLTQNVIDFNKISEKYKEHSRYLITDLSNVLDSTSPIEMQKLKEKFFELEHPVVQEEVKEVAKIELEKDAIEDNSNNSSSVFNENSETEKIKERLILDDEEEISDDVFDENLILKFVKEVDILLNTVIENPNDDLLRQYSGIMKVNAEVSTNAGFSIIANMHKIVSKALFLLSTNKLERNTKNIEQIRYCLIVIAATVKKKDVNITNYLNKAEDFGQSLLMK